ncbi:uncharacterized protein MJAP1_002417 [Malassezia japonica]|uniref:Ricin B lectin domain-containing protein n=1 Tax=Malassezia japonica TaxID=223818 RepID=A0AAF0F288_9BASI|nr:uncharacterized protein MJAP1_002417 [Malassezia japonica]WFD39440.1 hypothetical protein MJAP1_002417 [Malassezia japonica]
MFANVRFAALFAFVALAQLATAQDAPAPAASSAPAPPPAPSSSAPAAADATPQAAAAQPNSKVVRSIDCNSGFNQDGALKVAVDGGNSNEVQLTGDPAELSTGTESVQVTFTECKSAAMGYESKDSMHYGILSPSDAAKKTCLRAAALAQADQHVQAQDCSLSDDSSQMGQTWAFDADKKTFTFVGRPNDDGAKPYSLGLKDNFVTVSANGTAAATLSLA